MDGIHRFEIPTPFDVGRVNCYALTDGGLIVVDPGPATDAAYEALSSGLNGIGASVADVDRVLITHAHMDHFGLASRIVEESGARTSAHRDAVPGLTNPAGQFERERALFEPVLTSMGVPEGTVESTLTLPEAYTEYRDPLAVDDELTDGDVISVGRDLTVVHTPGHAPGEVCFVAPASDLAFTGDHVLQHITPNPLLTVAPGAGGERTRSLPAYLDSLRTLARTGASVGHGGHGKVIRDLPARVQETLDHHHHRKERIAGIVEATEPTTPYEVMQELFPELPATEVFPGISEIVGHLDLLEDEGRVRIEEGTRGLEYRLR